MNKIINMAISFAVITLFACGDASNKEATEEVALEETMENHEEHDHAAMENNEEHDHTGMQEETEEQDIIPPPEDAKVFFGNINEGEVLQSPVRIEMIAEGINVHPAGELIEGTGHHHILIDGGPLPMGEIIPADDLHIHFGGGQTEAEIELAPGPHAITLQFADGLHRSYGERLSATIQIEVAAAE